MYSLVYVLENEDVKITGRRLPCQRTQVPSWRRRRRAGRLDLMASAAPTALLLFRAFSCQPGCLQTGLGGELAQIADLATGFVP
jgi:hypothetical protein